jgi:IclR family acetate operon transcriptional repressor
VPAEVQQGLGRAAAVLAALGASTSGPLRASDLSRATGLGASTMARLLGTLEELGYVRKLPDTQGYTIGHAVLALASAGLNQNPVHREARAPAQELAQRVGLSVNVAVADATSAIYLCHFEGHLAPKSHTMVGLRQPIHASALGKALLLGSSADERRALLGEGPFPRFTAHTLTTHDALTADLAASAERGSCIEEQELALGRLCVAAPVRDATGRVVAAISVSGRLSVMRTHGVDALGEDVIETADRISVGLGMISAVPPGP